MKQILQKQLTKVNAHYCVDSFSELEHVVKRVFEFAKRYDATL